MTEPTYTQVQLDRLADEICFTSGAIGYDTCNPSKVAKIIEVFVNCILAKQRDELLAPGPCGKHLAIFWVEGAHTPHEGDLEHICAPDCESDYCTLCIEEQHIRDEAYGEALRAAAAMICQFCAEAIPLDDAGHIGDRHCYAKTIRALTPTAIREAQERHDAEIRLDEAKWWEHIVGNFNPEHSDKRDLDCMYCQRLAELEHAATKSQAEGKKT